MVVRIQEGGTGQTTAPGARIALGLSDQNIIDIVTPSFGGPYQPQDSDLTAIAALSTTAFGRAFLALVDAAGGRTYLELGTMATETAANYLTTASAAATYLTIADAATDYQPLDSDLTAIAALTTTSYGRGLLELADAAAARAALSLGTMATETATNYIPYSDINKAVSDRYFRYMTSGSPRWDLGATGTAESGSDVGSDFALNMYDDTGTYVMTPLFVRRETGVMEISQMYVADGAIRFPATQIPWPDGNTLDDYEEGTWTPTLTFVTPGNLSVVYGTRVGWYTKIWNLVTLSWAIITTTWTHTTASGNLTISGVPFAADSLVNMQQTGVLSTSGLITGSGTFWTSRILVSANTIEFIGNSTVGSARIAATTAHATTGTQQVSMGSISYRTTT